VARPPWAESHCSVPWVPAMVSFSRLQTPPPWNRFRPSSSRGVLSGLANRPGGSRDRTRNGAVMTIKACALLLHYVQANSSVVTFIYWRSRSGEAAVGGVTLFCALGSRNGQF
jgi:hypothetical protein